MADIEDSLETLYDHPGLKTKSLVWKHFGFLKTKEGPANFKNLDMSRAICKLCRRVYANKGRLCVILLYLLLGLVRMDCCQRFFKVKQSFKFSVIF